MGCAANAANELRYESYAVLSGSTDTSHRSGREPSEDLKKASAAPHPLEDYSHAPVITGHMDTDLLGATASMPTELRLRKKRRPFLWVGLFWGRVHMKKLSSKRAVPKISCLPKPKYHPGHFVVGTTTCPAETLATASHPRSLVPSYCTCLA